MCPPTVPYTFIPSSLGKRQLGVWNWGLVGPKLRQEVRAVCSLRPEQRNSKCQEKIVALIGAAPGKKGTKVLSLVLWL